MPDTKLALVTGASSGIGKAFAEQLAATGHDLIVVGRNAERLQAVADTLPVDVTIVEADLSALGGISAVTAAAEGRPVDVLVNNAGVAHYMPFTELPADKAQELLFVKAVAPTLFAHAVVGGMVERGHGAIVNVAGMLAYSGPAPLDKLGLRRAVYVGVNAHLLAMSETLAAEFAGTGVTVQALCPGIVATEFHQRQGIDMDAVPRMSATDVAAASLRGIELGETVCAPGVEDASVFADVAAADLAAFDGQSPQLASRYRADA